MDPLTVLPEIQVLFLVAISGVSQLLISGDPPGDPVSSASLGTCTFMAYISSFRGMHICINECIFILFYFILF